jgi:hypothetical protein
MNVSFGYSKHQEKQMAKSKISSAEMLGIPKDILFYEILVSTIAKGGQDVTQTVIERFAKSPDQVGKKIRFQIQSDSNRSQCFARAHVWSDATEQWNHIYSIPYALMKTQPTMYAWPSSRPVTAKEFEEDLIQLRRVVLSIVF